MHTTDEVVQLLQKRCEILRADGGGRLPSERTLAEELGASRSTVRRALSTLQDHGEITIMRGRNGGARVTTDVPWGGIQPDSGGRPIVPFVIVDGRSVKCGANRVSGLPQVVYEHGRPATNHVLSLTLDAADGEVAELLDVAVSAPVISLVRLRFVDAKPFSLDHMFLDYRRFPDFLNRGLGGNSSMYAVLEEAYGVSITMIEHQVAVVPATEDQACMLDIQEGDPLFALRRRASDADGRPVECSFDLLRADRTRLKIQTVSPMRPVGEGDDRVSCLALEEDHTTIALMTS